MIQCEKCHKVLLTIQQSSELYVRGEIQLVVLCQDCQHVNYISLFEYGGHRRDTREVFKVQSPRW
jgi:RNase P subunit RPR2